MKLLIVFAIVCCLGFSMGFSFETRQENPATVGPTGPTGNEVAPPRPTILQMFEKTRFWRWVPYAARFLDFLNDQEVSNKLYNLLDGRKQIWREALGCAEKQIVASLNDASTIFGRAVAIIRMGQGPLTSFRDFRSVSPITVLPLLWLAFQNFDVRGAILEGETVLRKTADTCLSGDLKQYNDDVEYLIQQFEDKVYKKTPKT